jgi:hypothetical protein
MDSREAWAAARSELEHQRAAGGAALADPAAFVGRTCTAAEALTWAADHLALAVGPEDAPGPAAWSLLALGRREPRAFLTLYARLVPPPRASSAAAAGPLALDYRAPDDARCPHCAGRIVPLVVKVIDRSAWDAA